MCFHSVLEPLISKMIFCFFLMNGSMGYMCSIRIGCLPKETGYEQKNDFQFLFSVCLFVFLN